MDARQARIGPWGRRVASRVGWGLGAAAVGLAAGAIFINPTPNQGEAQGASASVPSCAAGTIGDQPFNLCVGPASASPSATATPSATPSVTPSVTQSPTPSPTASPTPTQAPTPSPTPTVTPTPSPTPSGFPGLSNTGVPAGLNLAASGSMTITTAGSTVDAKDIRGTVNINASNVTLKRSRVTASGFSIIRIKEGVTGVRIEDVTVDGLGNSGTAGSNCIWGPVTVVRANVTGCENGFVGSSGSTLQDSWLHGLTAPGSPHIDGVQEDGGISNVKILHNTIDMSSGAVSAVMVDNYFGAARDVTVDNNRLLGGQYTVYSDGSFNSNAITGVSFTNNRMKAGNYGYSLIRGSGAAGVVWTGNVNDATGAVVNK